MMINARVKVRSEVRVRVRLGLKVKVQGINKPLCLDIEGCTFDCIHIIYCKGMPHFDTTT